MPKITEMYAFVTHVADVDDEGVCASLVNGSWMPMVGTDLTRVTALMPFAVTIAKEHGKPVRILKFSNMEEMAVINP